MVVLGAEAMSGRGAGGAGVGSGGFHRPALVAEVLEFLRPERGGLYVDGTVGGGGHGAAILERSDEARLVGADRDPGALVLARERLSRFGERVRLVLADYADLAAEAELAPGSVAGVLLDLGVSSHQVDDAARGFTFRRGAPLDMRMSGPGGGGPTAADLLNTASEAELARIFREYGEERRARALASGVVRRRCARALETSDDLVAVLSVVLGRSPSAREKARIFQALRIAVNRELESLEAGLPRLRETLAPGGVMVVISYHSLEDRLVKTAFREWSCGCACPPDFPVCRCGRRSLGEVLTRGVVRPGAAEVVANPRVRSARLRAWRRAA